jgi:hypothetical protein
MIRHGKAPFLECSCKGDKRFSAFYARVNGKSIEEQYQAAKIFENGSTGLSWKQAKGKEAINMEEVSKLYGDLWWQYLREHPDYFEFLQEQSGLSDIFGQEGHNCQATVLWNLTR